MLHQRQTIRPQHEYMSDCDEVKTAKGNSMGYDMKSFTVITWAVMSLRPPQGFANFAYQNVTSHDRAAIEGRSTLHLRGPHCDFLVNDIDLTKVPSCRYYMLQSKHTLPFDTTARCRLPSSKASA
jgi:hypothetical protein